MGFPGETPESGVQSHQLQRGHEAHRIRSSSGKVTGMVWGCLTGRMGEPEVEGSPEVAEGEAGETGVTEREKEGKEMEKGKGVKERCLPPAG